jgi:ferrous iron transport protein B
LSAIFFPLFTILENLGYLPRVAFNLDRLFQRVGAHGKLDPVGRALGLDGVILLAYVMAIPANEIVVPTILMAYAGSGMLVEIENLRELRTLLVDQHGWTLLTAACLMLFSVLHNPCSTTIWTIHKETGSAKWTTLGTLIPLALAFIVTFAVAQVARLMN